jgi:stage III sporulation protein AA
VDERGEIFPVGDIFEPGLRTDVLTGCSKAQGVQMALRTMGPTCIAMDEITATEDCQALLRAAWCGVELLATAHASDVIDLRRRPVYRPLVQSGLFSQVIVLNRDKSWHMERMELCT